MRTEELFAHAIAIEHEAAARYVELGERLGDFGDERVGGLFQALAQEDIELEQELKERGARFTLPSVPHSEHAWLDLVTPQRIAHGLIMRVLTPYSALVMARDAEQRALDFFEQAADEAPDPATAQLARMLAEDERLHLKRVERLLAQTPDPLLDWSAFYG